VLNDAGTLVPKAALERIGRYVGRDPRFGSLEELEAHVRWISAPFGRLDDAQWRHLTEHCATRHADGTWGFNYDPAIANPLQGELQDVDLSAFFDRITAPTLVLRGANSDILLRETAQAMTRRGPKAQLVEFADVGHAPMLLTDEQVAPVRDFLLAA
jgi:pimeloyl-ACP methyl ester carboxylesterase